MAKLATFHDLKDASVFITGGGSGIGAALTEGFAAQGAKVAFVDLQDGTAMADRLGEAYRHRPLAIRGDITDTGALRAAIDEAGQAHGPVTRLVNNAANDDRHTTAQVTEDYWERMIGINLKAYFFACQAAIPGMQKAGGGAIVNFSSISYMMGNSGYPVYTASNGGINAMTRSLAREFGADGIRANAVMPGWVLTDKQKELWASEEALAAHLDRQCLKQHMAPEDMVHGVLFLASDAARMMTGQALVIDAGVVVTG